MARLATLRYLLLWFLLLVVAVGVAVIGAVWKSDADYKNCVTGKNNRALVFAYNEELPKAIHRLFPQAPNLDQVDVLFDQTARQLAKRYPPVGC